MKKVKKYEFTIAEHYATALINGDYTGLSDLEDNLLTSFELRVISEYGNGHWSISDEEPSFSRCDIGGLYANCANFEWVVM